MQINNGSILKDMRNPVVLEQGTVSQTSFADRSDYWQSYYGRDQRIRDQTPSQFAAFVAGETTDYPLVVDIGCGNGRDTEFFARYGYSTVAIDESERGIAEARKKVSSWIRQENFHLFFCLKISSIMSSTELITRILPIKKVIYSRFFIHAINEHEQINFLHFISKVMGPEDVLALEFRTKEDEHLQKVTGDHYRRYIDSQVLAEQISRECNLNLQYFAQGRGFAKYYSDDAHVARLIFEKI